MLTRVEEDRVENLEIFITKKYMKDLESSFLFRSMVEVIGINKTIEVLNHYIELKIEVEKGELNL